MVFVVNVELNMSPGKMAAQVYKKNINYSFKIIIRLSNAKVGHAAVACYRELISGKEKQSLELNQWEMNG